MQFPLHVLLKFNTYVLFDRLGPLVNCWCMRMEAKHSYFKKISQIGNYINVPYSVAVRHQRLRQYPWRLPQYQGQIV